MYSFVPNWKIKILKIKIKEVSALAAIYIRLKYN